jgi:pimeloyl-ACP methyl ester carboxylesterase
MPNMQEILSKPDSLVFLGGINYDRARNDAVGKSIIALSGYEQVITIDVDSPNKVRDDTVRFEYPEGGVQELPSKLAMKQLNDNAIQRYSMLHARRARALIDAIEQSGGRPVDAVFQSVDTSTGILAMRERPDLFRKVVLVDPSSLIKHPTRSKFFKEFFRSGDAKTLLQKPPKAHETVTAPEQLSLGQRIKRMRKTSASGNMLATYLSVQSKMLHEIAQLDNAPIITILASRLDHAYSPAKIIESLEDIHDISALFVSESRHAISKSSNKLAEIIGILTSDIPKSTQGNDIMITFANAVPTAYREVIHHLTRK